MTTDRTKPVSTSVPAAGAREVRSDVVPSSGLLPEAYEGLPMLIAEMAEVAGLDVALTIARERGGNRVYIPASADDDHWLVKLVGRPAANKLIRHFASQAGIELAMPRGPTGSRAAMWRQLYKMIDEGYPSTEITRRLGISRDTVKYHRAKLRHVSDRRQLSLLDLLPDE